MALEEGDERPRDPAKTPERARVVLGRTAPREQLQGARSGLEVVGPRAPPCLPLAVAHLGGSALWIASTVLWQKHVDSAFRGRVFVIEFMSLDLAFTVGGFVGGFLGNLAGNLLGGLFGGSSGGGSGVGNVVGNAIGNLVSGLFHP